MIHLTTYIFENCEVWTFQRRAGRPHRVSRKDFPSLGRKLSQYTTKSFIFWRPSFLSKTHFFAFRRKIGFNLEKMSNHYSQLKKHLKVDPETRSCYFLTKTREKNPMSRNIRILATTSESGLNNLKNLEWQFHYSKAPLHIQNVYILNFQFLTFD